MRAGITSKLTGRSRNRVFAYDAYPANLNEDGRVQRSGVYSAGMSRTLQTVLLLTLSNVFMTFAWYGHLKHLKSKPLIVAILVSWSIALFEYMLQVPANRIGHQMLSLGQLKILQEIITLAVFVPFAIFYMREPFSMNYVYAGFCLLGAVYFIFVRST
jgi:uncharacterized protein (DUF486 family)